MRGWIDMLGRSRGSVRQAGLLWCKYDRRNERDSVNVDGKILFRVHWYWQVVERKYLLKRHQEL